MKTVIIDNFFSDPDLVRKFALSLDYVPRTDKEYFEGVRSKPIFDIDKEFYYDVCSRILVHYFRPGNYDYKASIFFHQTKNNDKQDTQWINDKIHIDKSSIIAGVLYLTPNAPIGCGTQTYTKINDEYVTDIVMGNQYNRLVIYPAKQPHSAMDLFGNDNMNRLVMLFFLEDIIER